MDGFDSTSQRYLLRVFTGQPGAKPKIATWKTGSLLFLWIKKLGTYIYIYVHIDRCIVMYMCTNLYILFEFWDILYWHTYAYSTIVAASIASASIVAASYEPCVPVSLILLDRFVYLKILLDAQRANRTGANRTLHEFRDSTFQTADPSD